MSKRIKQLEIGSKSECFEKEEKSNMKYWIVTIAILFITAAGIHFASAEKYTPYQLATRCYNLAEFSRTTVKVRDMGISEEEYLKNMDENREKFRLDDETFSELLNIAHEIYSNPAQDPDGAFDFYMMSCSHPKDSI